MPDLVRRDDYMDLLYAGKDLTDVVKVITGMRRSGKSTLLEMYRAELKDSGIPGSDMVSIDFETFEYKDIRTSEALDGLLTELIGETGFRYVFLDEVQNVEGWESSVSSLVNTRRCDIYITGSNSKLLSSEIATHIAGRYVEIKIQTLSFREYLEMHPGDRMTRFSEYLRFGSLPAMEPGRGERFCEDYLTGVFNTILINDILTRMGNGNAETLRRIAGFLYSNIGDGTNIDSISETLELSNGTVSKYVSKLLEASLFYRAERYDIAGRKVMKTNGKFYASDLGLRNAALLGAGGTDMSGPMENIVYLELQRRGYTVRVGSFKDTEVDFTAFRDGDVEYFQVCQTMMGGDTRHRELGPLKGIRDNYRKTILTLDVLGPGSDEGIRIVNLVDWLLDDRA